MIGLLPPLQCSEAQAYSAVDEDRIVSKLDGGAVFVFAHAVEVGGKHHAWLSFPADWTMSTFCVAACLATSNAAAPIRPNSACQRVSLFGVQNAPPQFGSLVLVGWVFHHNGGAGVWPAARSGINSEPRVKAAACPL